MPERPPASACGEARGPWPLDGPADGSPSRELWHLDSRSSNSQEAVASLARKMWEGSGLGPDDVDIFNPYDGYLTFTQQFLEGFQWHGVKWGEAHDFYADEIRVEGPHPFLSSGGNNGSGRNRAVLYADSIQQLRGTAGARQVTVKAETALAGCNTPDSNGFIMFSKNPS